MAVTNKQSERLTTNEMQKFTDLIYKTAGIRIPQQKVSLLSNRIRRRLKATETSGYTDYYDFLCRIRPTDTEWDAFLQEVTTHETYLFRDEHQWDWFQTKYLPEMVQEARKNSRSKSLRVWSAASSTGDEAHTIAMCALEKLRLDKSWSVDILGTDIGVDALEAAKAGVFGERAMQLVPDNYKKRYFTKNEANTWTAKDDIRKLMKFRQHNLMKPFTEKPFDIIFLKNVLIYFDPPSKEIAMGYISKVLKPGGMFVLGPAEGVADNLAGMERIHPWLYRNPTK